MHIILAAGTMVFSVLGTRSFSANAETITEVEETSASISCTTDERDPEKAGSMVQVDEVSAISSTDDVYKWDGEGTEDDPYEISSADDLLGISTLSSSMAGNGYYYFTITKSIDLTNVSFKESSFITTYFQGEIDGNNKTITAPSDGCWLASDSVGTAKFSNIIINHGNNGYFGLLQSSGYYSSTTAYYAGENDNEVTFDNVYSSGSYTVSNNVSAYACLVWGTCYFNNCTSNAKISVTGYAGVFVGGYPYNAKISFNKCYNKGSVSGSYIGFFNGNSPSTKQAFEVVNEFGDLNGYSQAIVTDCANTGTMHGTYTCTAFSTNYNTYNKAANEAVEDVTGKFSKGDMITGNQLDATEIYLNADGTVGFEAYDDDGKVINGTFTVDIFVSISDYSEKNGTSYGSSYVMITTTYIGNITDVSAIYATRIVSSDVWDSEVEDSSEKYENLIKQDDIKVEEDSYGGHEYILYKNTIIVDSDSLESVESTTMGSAVGYVVCDNVPTYRISVVRNDITTGTAEFSASTITTKTTD